MTDRVAARISTGKVIGRVSTESPARIVRTVTAPRVRRIVQGLPGEDGQPQFQKTIVTNLTVPADHVQVMHDNLTLLGVDVLIELTADIVTL